MTDKPKKPKCHERGVEGCLKDVVASGFLCVDHGCARCGGEMHQGTDDWRLHLCPKHLEELQQLGGGAPDRYGVTDVVDPPPPPPKRYPSLADLAGLTMAICRECERAFPLATATLEWPEPLCAECYTNVAKRPPRAVLTFFDGTREMRRNPIVGKVYRDVDDSSGDVVVRWFERVSDQEENGKPVMSFWREIERPVDSLGRPISREIAKRHVPWWRRMARWVRAWLAVRGIA